MRIHALEATGGLTYAQMPRFATADGKGTRRGRPPRRARPASRSTTRSGAVWINETALATALNTGYMADQLALFGIVVGFALLLSGIGFGILAVGGALRNPDTAVGTCAGTPAATSCPHDPPRNDRTSRPGCASRASGPGASGSAEKNIMT